MIPQGAKPLAEADFDRLVGIDRETVISANLVRVDNFTARQLTGQNGPHDLSGIAIPYYRPGTSEPLEYSVRLDDPPMTELGKNGEFKETRKYLWPMGRPNRFYIPPGTKAEWLLGPSIPAVFVEGVKKALAFWGLAFHGLSETAEKPRFVVIGLNGVWNWLTKTGREETEDGGWNPTSGPLPDFAWFAWEKRPVIILYDSNVQTNPNVRAARKGLAQELRSRNVAEVCYVDLPPIEGINGIDDLLGLWSKDRVLALLEDESYDSATFALTDLGNAERFVYQHSENVRFCHELGKSGEWLTWTGQRWQLDSQKRSVELAKDTVRSMKAEADRLFEKAKPDLDRLQVELELIPSTDKKKRAEIQKQIETAALRAKKVTSWQQRSEQKRSIFDMLTLAQSVPDVCVSLSDLDQNHLLFNTANGTIDLSTGKLRKPRREDLITQMSPVRYDATAACPLWEKFLSEVFAGHEDLIPFIQTYVGYSLTGLTKEEYLAVLHGEGRNGKGTFIKRAYTNVRATSRKRLTDVHSAHVVVCGIDISQRLGPREPAGSSDSRDRNSTAMGRRRGPVPSGKSASDAGTKADGLACEPIRQFPAGQEHSVAAGSDPNRAATCRPAAQPIRKRGLSKHPAQHRSSNRPIPAQ
jgi:D5 N terminal like/Domain of unknown function (DUF3854)